MKVDLLDSLPFFMGVGRTGFVMCGFLNVDTAERLNVVAAMVSGVKDFDDAFEAEVKAATSKLK